MGIIGLLPFLEKSSQRTNINQFAGGTVAIDSYCWLHKGVFSCAVKLQMGQSTDAYVHYCMKFIDMLLSYKIKPILVFDGRYLPAKAQTEAKRREARQTNRRKGIELIKIGQHVEGRKLLQRSIDVTHEMALELIKQCHQMNIDCIVAPYEADAQLAYLNISGIADVVITEDSDLTLFGCKKIFFKMDINGNGLLVDQERLHLAMDLQSEHFSIENFRYMCILSGCDYLPSLPGIGLNKAKKFIMKNTDNNIHRALTRLGSYLNMKSLVVTEKYRDAFILAVITFKHQLVFCPLQRKQVRLNPPTSDVTEEQLYYAGVETNPDIALQLAFGNWDPISLKPLHDFNPDKVKSQDNKSTAWKQKIIHPQHISIWSKKYKLQNNLLQASQNTSFMACPDTSSKEMVLQTSHLKKAFSVKQDNFECTELNQKEILNTYDAKVSSKTEENLEIDVYTPDKEKMSPVLVRRANPFSKESSSNKSSPSLLFKSGNRIKGRNMTRVRRTIINEELVVESKFFSKSANDKESNSMVTNKDVSFSSNNSNEILLKKENMQLERTNETNDNFQTLMITDKIKIESHPMDIDKEHNNALPESHQCNNIDSSNNLYNCDLSSYLDVKINELNSNKRNQELCNLSTSLTLLKPDIDSDFLVQQEDINTSNSSLFKWSNTKPTAKINNKMTRKNFTNSGIAVNNKTHMTNSTRQSQQLCSVQRQQSLLSMYGFEKRK
ncbi:exonuclease tos isoform X2 [Ptiloglossa arizonensis]